MMNELPFNGFKELIEGPLGKNDPKSFNSIKRMFLDEHSIQQNPFSTLLFHLAGKEFPNKDAITHWRHILENKKGIEQKLGRTVGIQTAAIDYFDQQNANELFLKFPFHPQEQPPSPTKQAEEWIERIYTPGYHLEKLKEEMLRAKRYKHALTAILLDVDEFRKINDTLTYRGGDQVLTLLVKIIKKTIRTVDILTRYSGDRFLLILPNTNKREAIELAERIRENVSERTKKMPDLPTGVTITLSVGQCTKDDSSADFLKRMVTILEDGKRKRRNTVYSMP
jgi:diguanylate cyclase (GGDEF)-like protein